MDYRVTYDFFARSHDGDDWVCDQRQKNFPSFVEAKQFVDDLNRKDLISANIFECYSDKKLVKVASYDFI
jgi:hypothetical protein